MCDWRTHVRDQLTCARATGWQSAPHVRASAAAVPATRWALHISAPIASQLLPGTVRQARLRRRRRRQAQTTTPDERRAPSSQISHIICSSCDTHLGSAAATRSCRNLHLNYIPNAECAAHRRDCRTASVAERPPKSPFMSRWHIIIVQNNITRRTERSCARASDATHNVLSACLFSIALHYVQCVYSASPVNIIISRRRA